MIIWIESGPDLFKQEEINAHCSIQQERWQEDVQEELIGLDAEPPGNGIAQAAHATLCGKHKRL